MKTIKTTTALIGHALILALIAPAFGGEKTITGKESYAVVTEKSHVQWKGKKVTGSHHGKVGIGGGSLEVKGGQVSGGSIEFDLTTITCEDLDEEYRAKLIGHLKSDDFFSVDKHPKAALQIKKTEAIEGAGKEEHNTKVTADLTIKGVTQEITFTAKIDVIGAKIVARGDLTFDRTLWDVRYGSGKFTEGLGDKMIYDDVEISFVLIAEAAKG